MGWWRYLPLISQRAWSTAPMARATTPVRTLYDMPISQQASFQIFSVSTGSLPRRKGRISWWISSRTAKRSASREMPAPTMPASVSTWTKSMPSVRGVSVKGNLMGILRHLAWTLTTFMLTFFPQRQWFDNQPGATRGPYWIANLDSVGYIRGAKFFAVGDLCHGFAGCTSGSAPFEAVPKRQYGDEFHLLWDTQQFLDGVLLLFRSYTDETSPQAL